MPHIGVKATLIYLAVYAFMQIGAFAVVTLLRRKDVIGEELKDLSGLFQRSPLAGTAMLLFMLSLGGIPPTAGFMGKFWLFSAAIDGGYYWLAVIGVLNSAVSLYYYLRVVVFMWFKGEPTGSEPVISPGHGDPPGRDHRRRRSRSASIRGRCSTWPTCPPGRWAPRRRR